MSRARVHVKAAVTETLLRVLKGERRFAVRYLRECAKFWAEEARVCFRNKELAHDAKVKADILRRCAKDLENEEHYK